MKITRIKSLENRELDIEGIAQGLVTVLNDAGFKCGYNKVTRSGMNISGHRCSFTIDKDILGYNLRKNMSRDSLTGWKRTNTPTWDQRVQFNQIVQRFFDANNLQCKAISGVFIVKDLEQNYDEYDWQDQKPDYMYQNERNGYNVIKRCNEKKYKELEKQCKKRAKLKKYLYK